MKDMNDFVGTWAVLVLLITSACGRDALPPVYSSEPLNVSLVQLIANPGEFHGKVVRVIGFCRLEFEGNALYLHREDFEHHISRNGVWLGVGWPVREEQRALSDEYVVVQGTFDAVGKGHMGHFAGELNDIVRFERWPSRVEFERSQRLHPADRGGHKWDGSSGIFGDYALDAGGRIDG